MPIDDREYYRDESSIYDSYRGGGGGGMSGNPYSGGTQSVIFKLIIVNVIIFGIDAFSGPAPIPGELEDKGNWLSYTMSLKAFAAADAEAVEAASVPIWQQFPLNLWQIATHGFAHASITTKSSIFHVGFNMMVLFMLGLSVERKYGGEEFLKFYLAALLFSGVLSLAYNMLLGHTATLVGASGAVTAVVILFVLNFPRQKLLLFGVIPMPAWVLGLVIVGMDMLNAFNPGSRIGWYAHLAGALFAVIYFRTKMNFNWLKLGWLKDKFSGKPKLRVHTESRRDVDLKMQADEILEKVHREGQASLSRKEQKTLEKYSRQVRQNRE